MKGIGLFVFVVIITSSIHAQWERTNGPEGGQITMLETIGDTTYLGTKVKGVYFSIDDGMNWTVLNSGMEHFEVTSLVTNGSHLFAGTGENGVYRSTDGGQTWLAPTTPGNALSISSLVVKGQYLFAGSYIEGVFRSSDNGDTWEESLPGFLNSIFDMCVVGNTIYASSYGITFATDDNGDTWYEVDDLSSGFIWSFFTSDNLFLGGATNRIYRSVDQGNTFEIINIPFEFPVVDILSISSINDTLYIGTSFYGVYRSTDNGTTWSPTNMGMGPKEVKSLTATSSSTLIAGVRSAGVFRSENRGEDWSKSNTGLLAGSTNLVLLSYQGNTYAGSVDDGVFKSEDNGETWIKLTSDIDTIHYGDVRGLCAKDGAIFASARYHTSYAIYKYIPNEEIWVRRSEGLPIDLYNISDLATSGSNILAATWAGLYYSSDDGASWQLTDLPAGEVECLGAAGNAVVYATVGGAIFKSTNDGLNWTLNKLTGLEILDISANENFAWAGTRYSGAIYTDDYGSSWYTCSGFPTDAGVFAIEPVSDGMVVAASSIAPWLYASFDDGSSFSPYGEGVVPLLPCESLAVNDEYMFAGSNYSGVWKRENPFFVDIQEVSFQQNSFFLYQNYPNPFGVKTTIPFDLHEETHVALEIFTFSGEKIITLFAEQKKAGHHEFDFYNQYFPAGLYYYRLSDGNSTATKKMLIIE